MPRTSSFVNREATTMFGKRGKQGDKRNNRKGWKRLRFLQRTRASNNRASAAGRDNEINNGKADKQVEEESTDDESIVDVEQDLFQSKGSEPEEETSLCTYVRDIHIFPTSVFVDRDGPIRGCCAFPMHAANFVLEDIEGATLCLGESVRTECIQAGSYEEREKTVKIDERPQFIDDVPTQDEEDDYEEEEEEEEDEDDIEGSMQQQDKFIYLSEDDDAEADEDVMSVQEEHEEVEYLIEDYEQSLLENLRKKQEEEIEQQIEYEEQLEEEARLSRKLQEEEIVHEQQLEEAQSSDQSASQLSAELSIGENSTEFSTEVSTMYSMDASTMVSTEPSTMDDDEDDDDADEEDEEEDDYSEDNDDYYYDVDEDQGVTEQEGVQVAEQREPVESTDQELEEFFQMETKEPRQLVMQEEVVAEEEEDRTKMSPFNDDDGREEEGWATFEEDFPTTSVHSPTKPKPHSTVVMPEYKYIPSTVDL